MAKFKVILERIDTITKQAWVPLKPRCGASQQNKARRLVIFQFWAYSAV
jgi:hypothetical protein